MRKVSMMVLIAVFAVIGLAAQGSMAKEKKAKTASAKEARWHGMIVRSNKDASTLTVRRRGQTVEKIIHYDSSTKWTTNKGQKAIEASEVKDGDEVICLGKYDDKNEFQATKIDLRVK